MNKTIYAVLIFAAFTNWFNLYSQGGWDVEYLKIDSINNNIVSFSVIPDFKQGLPNVVDSLEQDMPLWKEDVFYLYIEPYGILEFSEDRKVYADMCSFSEQSIISEPFRGKRRLKLLDANVLEVKQLYLVIEFKFGVYKGSNDKRRLKTLEQITANLKIPRTALDGFLYRKEN